MKTFTLTFKEFDDLSQEEKEWAIQHFSRWESGTPSSIRKKAIKQSKKMLYDYTGMVIFSDDRIGQWIYELN